MVALLRSRRSKTDREPPLVEEEPLLEQAEAPPSVDIRPTDPLFAYLREHPTPVDVDKLELPSEALAQMREAGIKLVVPLVTQGELIGTLNLGPRLSEQEYSKDDLKLLDNLASQAAPAVRVAQLVRQQEAEARQRERMEQELRVARIIQQNFLPLELPELSGWDVSVYYKPAREVGGDFYDFIALPEGRVGVVVADVTDKGVPAAMVMSAARTMLRATSQRLVAPGEVLRRVNDVLVDGIPPNMFVTCLYGVLDPETGRFVFANAGHNLPYLRADTEVTQIRATGMPLGLMPGMRYEEAETQLARGDSLLLCSDGIVEAHGPEDEMFSFGRLQALVGGATTSQALIDLLVSELALFTGSDWEQEDDVTLVALHRGGAARQDEFSEVLVAGDHQETVLVEFSVASEAGNERAVMDRVGEAVQGLGLEEPALDRLKTAVAEAAMNAIEHGNANRPELPVQVRVRATPAEVIVSVTDQGGGTEIPEVTEPDIEAKLAGEQSPRGWGLFLIRNLVDDVRLNTSQNHHTIELVVAREGDTHVRDPL